MDERVYWIWMQNAFGAGSAKPMQLVRRMGSAEAFFRGGIGLSHYNKGHLFFLPQTQFDVPLREMSEDFCGSPRSEHHMHTPLQKQHHIFIIVCTENLQFTDIAKLDRNICRAYDFCSIKIYPFFQFTRTAEI